MKINTEQTNGEESLNTLLKLTKLNKDFIKKVSPIIKELEKQGVFN